MVLRLHRRATSWIALASMVLNAAWPLLASAKPAAPASPSEICSASGLSHAAGGAPDAPDKGIHTSHCALCPFSSQCAAAIPYAGLPLPSPAPVAAPFFARAEAPRPEIAFHPAAPPRAPPLQS
jgi:hypothetical protein